MEWQRTGVVIAPCPACGPQFLDLVGVVEAELLAAWKASEQ